MRVRATGLEGVLLIEPDVRRDDRGFFLEAYQRRQFAEVGITDEFVQENHSRSRQGVLRGMHYQDLTAPMSKLVRCPNGSILDVAVDLRVGSHTFGKWFAAELSDTNMHQLFIPVGFAHGFLALSAWADVEYRCGGYYEPKAEGAIAWNDSDLSIRWPIADPVLAPRDASAMSLRQYLEHPAFHYPIASNLPPPFTGEGRGGGPNPPPPPAGEGRGGGPNPPPPPAGEGRGGAFPGGGR